MPIYEYQCNQCQARFDVLRPIAQADAPIPCQQCESMNTSRKVSAAYAHSGGRIVAGGGNNSGCGSCQGGSCSSCGH